MQNLKTGHPGNYIHAVTLVTKGRLMLARVLLGFPRSINVADKIATNTLIKYVHTG